MDASTILAARPGMLADSHDVERMQRLQQLQEGRVEAEHQDLLSIGHVRDGHPNETTYQPQRQPEKHIDDEPRGDQDQPDLEQQRQQDQGDTTFETPTIAQGSIWPDLESIKAAAQALGEKHCFTLHVKKRDTTRLILGCRSDKDCPFHLRAVNHKNGARIVALNKLHSCIGSEPPKRQQAASMQFLAERLPDILEVDTKTSTRIIQASVLKHFRTHIGLQQCQRVKQKLLGRVAPNARTYIQVCRRCKEPGHNARTCNAAVS